LSILTKLIKNQTKIKDMKPLSISSGSKRENLKKIDVKYIFYLNNYNNIKKLAYACSEKWM